MRVEAAALTQPMHRGHPPVADAPQGSCSPPSPDTPGTRTASKDRRGHTPSGTTPSIIMSPEPANAVPRTEVRPGARATRTRRPLSFFRRNPWPDPGAPTRADRPVCAGRRQRQDHAPAGWPSASL